jgi:hypothetical protein
MFSGLVPALTLSCHSMTMIYHSLAMFSTEDPYPEVMANGVLLLPFVLWPSAGQVYNIISPLLSLLSWQLILYKVCDVLLDSFVLFICSFLVCADHGFCCFCLKELSSVLCWRARFYYGAFLCLLHLSQQTLCQIAWFWSLWRMYLLWWCEMWRGFSAVYHCLVSSHPSLMLAMWGRRNCSQ